jgi:hypothetical protein
MSISAAIKFTQGATTAAAGTSVIGALGAVVTLTNGDNTNAVYWSWQLLDSPAASSLVVGPLSEGPASSISSFTPDVSGCYRIMLTVKDASNNIVQQIRNFGVRNSRGWLNPSYKSGADEMNFAGNTRGGAAYTDEIFADLKTVADTPSGKGPIPINVKIDYSATGGGTVSDRTQLLNASAAATGKAMFYPAGTYLLTSDTTFGTDVTHWFEQGAKIDAPGHTVTFSGPIVAHELQQIFTPATKVRFAQYYRNVPKVSPFWWGAKADLSTDDGPALQQWIDSVTGRSWAGSAEMVIPPAYYTIRQQLNMYGNSGSSVKMTGSVTSYAGRGSSIRHLGTPISSSTNPSGTSVVFTTDRPHGMLTFDRVKIKNHTGNTAIPAIGLSGQVTVLSTTTFSIDGLLGNGGSAGGTTGTAGGAVLQMKGVNNSTFTGVTFDGMGTCNTALWYRTDQAPTGGGGAGANGLYLHGCAFQGASGDRSTLLAFGEDGANTGGATYQAAEVNCYECTFTGSADPTNIQTMTDACWRPLQGGNVKDDAIRDSNFFGANILVDYGQASGTQVVDNCEFGGAYRYAFLVGGSQISITNCAIENANGTYAGGIFLGTFGTGSTGVGGLAMRDCQLVSPVWDQTIPISSVSNVNGVNRVVTCTQLPRYAGVGNIVVIDGNTDSAVNGTHTVTAVDMTTNTFTIDVTGNGGAAGTGGQYLNKLADGVFLTYWDHTKVENCYFDASDVAANKLGPPIFDCGILNPSYPSSGSIISEHNTYRFGNISLPYYSKSIASSTNTTPITITTSAAHGFFPGQQVCIQEHRVNTSALGIWTIGTTPSSTTFTLTGTTGNGVGGATGQVAPVAWDSIPVRDSGGPCSGTDLHAKQPLSLWSRGDCAGDQSNNTSKPLAPRDGRLPCSLTNSPILSYAAPGVRVLSGGEPNSARTILELDYKLFQRWSPYGGTSVLSRLSICRIQQNSIVKAVSVRIVTPFSPSATLRLGTSDMPYADNFLAGGGTGQYSGFSVSAAYNTVYPTAETDNGADLLRGALIQGGCWRALGRSDIDVVATLVSADVSALTAGVVRVYIEIDNFMVDYT